MIASMRTFTRKQGYCALGSVKSNIGHLLTAAGAASVIKVLLSMKHKMLPPTIHFQSLNDHISLDASPFYVNASLKAWEPGASGTRRAAVSSFGFSGTNAHLVLEEYPYANRNSAEEGGANGGQSFPSGGETLIFPLSAPDADSLKRYAKQLRDWAVSSAASNDSTMLKPLAYTMQTGREAMKVRMAVMASHVTDLIQGLDHFLNDHPSPVVLSSPQTAGGREQHDMYRLQGGPASGGQEYAANLSRQWVSGGEVVWRDLYTVRPMRLRLPGYPFKRERFWIHRAAIQAAPALEAIVPPASPLSDAKAYVYELLGRHSLGIQPGQSADELNELRPLIYLGLDSLVGIHIQNTIMKDYGIEVTMAQLMDGLHTKAHRAAPAQRSCEFPKHWRSKESGTRRRAAMARGGDTIRTKTGKSRLDGALTKRGRTMRFYSLLNDLMLQGIAFKVENGKLRFSDENGVMTESMLSALTAYRPDFVKLTKIGDAFKLAPVSPAQQAM